MPLKDPEKRREYQRRLYRESGAEKQKASVKTRFHLLRQKFAEYKATKACLKCGENDPHCLEFHHVDPQTKNDVNPARLCASKGWSHERLVAYLETTCLCVCSNCHRKIHRQIREIRTLQNSRVNPKI